MAFVPVKTTSAHYALNDNQLPAPAGDTPRKVVTTNASCSDGQPVPRVRFVRAAVCQAKRERLVVCRAGNAVAPVGCWWLESHGKYDSLS